MPVDLTRRRPQPPSNRAIALCGFLSSLTDQKTLLLYRAFFRQFLVPDATITPRVGALVADLAIPAGLAGRVPGVLAMRGRLRNRSSRGLLIGVGIGLALAHREQPACRGVEPGVANQGRTSCRHAAQHHSSYPPSSCLGRLPRTRRPRHRCLR